MRYLIDYSRIIFIRAISRTGSAMLLLTVLVVSWRWISESLLRRSDELFATVALGIWILLAVTLVFCVWSLLILIFWSNIRLTFHATLDANMPGKEPMAREQIGLPPLRICLQRFRQIDSILGKDTQKSLAQYVVLANLGNVNSYYDPLEAISILRSCRSKLEMGQSADTHYGPLIAAIVKLEAVFADAHRKGLVFRFEM